MRFVVDLQACQTEISARRGVGRYTETLMRHIAHQRGDDDLRLCFSKIYTGALKRAIDEFELHLPRQHLSAYLYPSIAAQGQGSRSRDTAVAEALVQRHWMSLQPDVLHIAHLFEGFHGQAVCPRTLPAAPGLVRSTTLYDLIPLRFPDQYLIDPAYKSWYMGQLRILSNCEHILAISASTRADAIELLGIDSDRITTIWGAVDPVFHPQQLTDESERNLRARYGLKSKIVLYTAGDDHRKNLQGAIEGYAGLPAELRRGMQLVIVCSISEATRERVLNTARKSGLASEEVILTGYVSDTDLASLYSVCDVFVFPSLYEGFGLPVLEAMSCGAPVVGADNSAVGEIIGRADALFDAQRSLAMTERVARVLQDSSFREALRQNAVERAKEFTWERSARLALTALRESHRAEQRRFSSVVGKASPKKRVAIFTPLPPARSGIADYSATFLPQLARYFEIDVFLDGEVSELKPGNGFNVFAHRDFADLRDRYDAVVYEMGNSEFHAYMLEYMKRYPGVVILHDAYLSGLYGYVDFNLGQAGTYTRESLHSHGPRARRYLAPAQQNADPIGATMINLPLSKTAIESAIGVISHTPFNLQLMHRHYPESIATPYRIIKQIVRIPERTDSEHRRGARAALGFREHDFVVCTFGHITWTKCGDVLLEAFSASTMGPETGAKLVFAGELARDDFGHRLHGAIESSAFKERVTITGYLRASDYDDYLAAADLAVQLRVQTRGGTSKAILDCMAHGVPLIVNEAGSFTDYPDDAIQKTTPIPDVAELAETLTLLYQRRDLLSKLSTVSRAYVAREHDPELIAAGHALAIDEFVQRSALVSLPESLTQIGAILADNRGDSSHAREVALALHANLAQPLFARQRILVDVTHINDSDEKTGIQRVVRNIVRWFYCSDRTGFDVIAVRLESNELVEASAWLRTQKLIPEHSGAATPEGRIQPRWGDILLMLDSSWAKIDEYLPVFEKIRDCFGKVYSVIYDLLPVRHPHLFVKGGADWFGRWLEKAVQNSDGIVCISRAVADELESFCRSVDYDLPPRLGYWHLGCDFQQTTNMILVERIRSATSRPTLLMVGTVEPRKNHALAIDAMEIVWANGVDANLCIAGKRGWMVEELMKRLRGHIEFGRRLHLIEQPSDEELHCCYQSSTGLLVLSAGEGFGLPIVEAAQFDTPIIANDIPVFREIAGEHASYVTLGSAQQLANDLKAWLERAARNDVPRSMGMPRLSWEQSAEALLDVVLDNRWYRLNGKEARA